GETHNFSSLVFLAKVPKVVYHHHVRPGDQIVYTATLADVRPEGGVTDVVAHVGDKLVAEAQIVFAQLSAEEAGIPAGVNQKNVVESGLMQVLVDAGVR
ncbi:MAG: beta-hydroxyacyl-ACP dehydratase, partial [Planctomycetaceae bacterium]|nr:beta-hydroxyacyl-ACP dehydratase [Planctomycetaceae bacterium]